MRHLLSIVRTVLPGPRGLSAPQDPWATEYPSEGRSGIVRVGAAEWARLV
jgi:hypothetical protein